MVLLTDLLALFISYITIKVILLLLLRGRINRPLLYRYIWFPSKRRFGKCSKFLWKHTKDGTLALFNYIKQQKLSKINND